ncbi:MAG: N-formylglutamate deformylase [Phreatobacter sp.]|uniref:N-formylglutamate deformylase n=1 Tax=Phreatobacter sp. TaxID=1966341 RepID=UPI0027377256|nr:N-formylglutamate deformylase [Phreatobacter sp.]MDP2801391.1 N-formylglutamate deformylase [Phreatobacter sp.]
MNPVTVIPGDGPLVLGQPHVGTMIPPEVSVALNDLGRSVPDTDWWLDRLYAGIAARTGATVIRQNLSRFVIDVNRDPSGVSLYPGQNTTTLCPTATFDAEPIYRDGQVPDDAEIGRRRRLYFAPFHAAMAAAIETARIRHGYCVLYDCHSIRSVVPNLFPGTLPVLNIGTNGGLSCAPALRDAAIRVAGASDLTFVADGRFKGGWITRHYGAPDRHVHAVQMELAQSAYMAEAPPWTYEETVAAKTEAVLDRIVAAILAAAATLEARP